ncbi:rho family small GTPase [Naegleria gruberi]|uniref:Rho family small GTPase n=1 Tax=Naegleria gruberi TaxID=5762 RepID=D2VDI0_NAEGR|nr:rho family small GTPase [Naegleria gruberi]EFC45144.1 rho family small GTPase [Naegleria gruberi]|eukprot:XP_002677888.1 rho family small GTPase [Naegleria gruberi strain NEG-M]
MNNMQNQQGTMIPIKICTVGDKKVGKTSMIQSYTQTPRELNLDPHYKRPYRPTVYDFSFSTVKLPVSIPQSYTKSKYSSASSNNSQSLKEIVFNLNFSDCSSLNCYTPMRLLSYDQCDIFFVCFRLDKAQSFYNAIDQWCPETRFDQLINSPTNSNNEDDIFFGQTCTSRSLSPEILCGEMIDIVESEQFSLKSKSRKSLTNVNSKPRSKTYSYRRNYSNPFMKRKRIPVQFNDNNQEDVEIPVLGDSMLDSCLSFVECGAEREVTWDMIESGRRQLDELGIDHVYYECPFNNQKSVQFIIEECVREFYKCKLSQNSSDVTQSASLLEKLKRVSL